MLFLNLFSRCNSEHLNDISTKYKHFVYIKNTKGITLVALVVTIIVLLILAGVTIMTLFGDNGLITMAQKAKSEAENAQANAMAELGSLIDSMDEALGIVKIPEGLEVGSEVTYNPSGTYEWKHKYCSSTKDEKVYGTDTDAFDLLESGKDTESGTDKPFNISSWRVLSINDTTGKVELVPKNGPTTGIVYLGQA